MSPELVPSGSELTFLPALRRGLIQAVTATDDPVGGALAGGPTLTAWVDVQGSVAETEVRLLGPESVAGVAAGQILRAEPRPDSSDVEPNYFPFLELATPDLPWMLTPARAGERGRLRPWLVLVTVPEQDGVSLTTRPGTALPVLSTPAGELPDLAESWAWAHVQSLTGTDGISDALQRGSGEVVARLVCPRRLLPDSAWFACLVPAFESGRLRGLGQAPPRGGELVPAWDYAESTAQVELPVYYSWRFTTGAASDFEALCRRLKPDGDGAELGRHAMEVGDPGLVPAAPRSVLVDMQGALQTPGVASRPWPRNHQEAFQAGITLLLDAAVARDPLGDASPDPIVAPPYYGSAPKGSRPVPGEGWLREVNDDPVRRAAAGLGAAVVRADQEALVAGAWDQAGDLRTTNAALNQARLGAEVAASWVRRVGSLADPDLLQFSAPMHAFLRTGGTSVRASLAASPLPAGLISAAYLRQSRPGGPLARHWRAATGTGSGRLALDHLATNLAATRPSPDPDDAPAIRFAEYGPIAGAHAHDSTLLDVGEPPDLGGEPSAALSAEVGRLLHLPIAVPRRPEPAAPPARRRPMGGSAGDVSAIAGTVRAALQPMASVRASLTNRIPALGDVLPADAPVPTTLALAPVFEDPLSDDLARLGAAWLLPGVERTARNRVRLVATNTDFVGAFLVGANHELARELTWRGYPVDTRATFFRRFWNYTADPPPADIGDLAAWPWRLSIAGNMARDGAGTAAATVVVVRGDLVRRYPSAHFFLQAAEPNPEPGQEPGPALDSAAVEPAFLGRLAPDTVFFGFDLPPGDVRARYYLAIEEQPGAPRLGLDEARTRDFTSLPRSWNNLSWGHLVDSQTELDRLRHARADSTRLAAMAPIDGVTWGRNSAHLARACWQRPFRMYIRAATLV